MSFTDIADSRVSPDQPPRENLEGMDWERCAKLHNWILNYGWQERGRTAESLPRRTWWDVYASHNEEAERLRSRLSPSLELFLQHAYQLEGGLNHSLFFYVYSLNPPSMLWTDYDDGSEDNITLYSANNIASHPDGIRFGQNGHDAIMQMSIGDSTITMNGRQIWHPLEVVLSTYIDMIEVGKVVALNDDRLLMPKEENGDPSPWKSAIKLDRYDPWVLVPYSEQQLHETVDTFAKLIIAIESRMPNSNTAPTQEPLSRRESLVADSVQEAANIPFGFIREFLSAARKPIFKNIAPGLRVPSISYLADLKTHWPFNVDELTFKAHEDENELMPTCLFPSSSGQTVCSPSFQDNINGAFEGLHREPKKCPAGLYISHCLRSSSSAFEDGCRLVLPFEIGLGGWAKASDCTLLGDDQIYEGEVYPQDELKGTNWGLYQIGYSPFIETHDVQLATVLQSWLDMVERGDWKVDENGVCGKLDDFKRAGSEEDWWKFMCPLSY